jgi:hypothetical protein
MAMVGHAQGSIRVLLLAVAVTLPLRASATPPCPAAQPEPLLPADLALCRSLDAVVRAPAALPLDVYETRLGDYLRNFCHRDAAAGWRRDKGVRDTGPYTASLQDGAWVGSYHGTHAPVVIWYSPEMAAWLVRNRGDAAPAVPEPIPAGAMIIKEMYPVPAAACAGTEPDRLLPTSGAAVMVRAPEASHDGWFWGWFGWSGWDPDWPPDSANRYPYMGFGQYCVNCHASAKDNLTFASPRNIEGEPGQPLVFLSQHWFVTASAPPPHHRLVALPEDDPARLGQPLVRYDPAFLNAFGEVPLAAPGWDEVPGMPSETYDNVWAGAGGPSAASQFLTSDQCIGCHDAGSTGLQFDMTRPATDGSGLLLNLSPYATWRTSPMGLGGRDPVFFAQLMSESDTFHPDQADAVQGICLGCHGVLGERRSAIDGHAAGGECRPFLRQQVNAVPWPDGNPTAPHAAYGALARDGISCTACHHMVLGEAASAAVRDAPQNACIAERQAQLNPDNSGFARTFTGSFLVGPPDRLIGPFARPKTRPMQNALGITPQHDATITSSELCGTCHTVHLPILAGAEVIGHTYEQTTYPEWAFSAYRTGTGPDGPLPSGAGAKAASCQDCHMPKTEADGTPSRSKIASIQEFSNFPQAENNLRPDDIDLTEREGFARHTLVGLNLFLVQMAQQFPDVLGIRTQDPMLVSLGLDPLLLTEQAILDQAANKTAQIAISGIARSADALEATVTVTSLTGHKLPSGVGFRRAFIELQLQDRLGQVLWASGRTDGAGTIVDAAGAPIAGEFWWQPDCSGRLADPRPHQPHYQLIERQDQAQIYQELVAAPGPGPAPACGHDVAPQGPLTTSFLSICAEVKDNRILPEGFLPLAERTAIAEALGAGPDLAQDAGSTAVGDDPDYLSSGADSIRYRIPLADLAGAPATLQATLYYQATPPFYLQDRFCTSRSPDTQRLYFLAGHLDLAGTATESWKLDVVSTGPVAVP